MSSEMRALKEGFDQVMSDKDILECIRLKKLYIQAKNRSLPTVDRIEILVESLLIAAAYEERLTSMKVKSMSFQRKAKAIFEVKKNEVIANDPSFFKKKVGDQERYISQNLTQSYLFIKEIEDYIKAIQESLEYVRSAQFNLKTIMATLKEYVGNGL